MYKSYMFLFLAFFWSFSIYNIFQGDLQIKRYWISKILAFLDLFDNREKELMHQQCVRVTQGLTQGQTDQRPEL